MEPSRGAARFLLRVTVLHVMTYFVVGIIAAIAIDYDSLFEQPVVRDYMREFGSGALFLGPVVQVTRGLLNAAVLLPFRGVLAGRHGWLSLWGLLVGIGILSTSAAAPSSIEGVVYTRIPYWYHAIGLPEMLVQTLTFSVLTALYVRYPNGLLAVLPSVFERIVRAVVAGSLAFVGYAVISVVFALVAGAGVDAEQDLTLEVQGLFIAPFVANAAIVFIAGRGVSSGGRLAAAFASYALGAVTILIYQALAVGDTSPLYGMVAPILPAVIIWLLVSRKRIVHSASAPSQR